MASLSAPCPNCGSNKVRWRKRRWYDGPLNFIETMMMGASRIQSQDGVSPMMRSGMDAKFAHERQIAEHPSTANRATAALFWRCPDCKQSGEDQPDDTQSAADNFKFPG
jgi:hypothetical protein